MGMTTKAQTIVNPDITYAGSPREVTIGGIAVSGVEGYEDYTLVGISGLVVGQHIELPGSEITEAVKRYWKHGLFSEPICISICHSARVSLPSTTSV